ncbi:MAG: M20/M25/M40 family metallo-hydrolase [Proteobacteria bacterium]|nr:M20/M25/M40 family metallo-hydrolase [Pseudomonadota bacterium]MDA1064556.1 M20/M25/M40 family metallo-hydrolase [Pseudomonadota bacterium]
MVFILSACSGDDEAQAAAEIASESGLAAHQQLAKDLLRELIQIDTTQAGSTTIAAEAMAARLLAAGFPANDVQVLGPTENRGNLVARLRGRDNGRKPLLLLAHIDVVYADRADWTMDPFTFLEQDGFFYGRGATDDKDEAAIYVANLIRMQREGFQPDRDIIVALTADEEDGVQNGVKWLIANHPELIDAEYVFNEGGGGSLRDGMRISNNVQASEKVFQSFTLEVTNPGGHSSLPVKDNAIYRLADALIRIRAHDFPVVLNEVTTAFFERTAGIEDGELAAAMRGVLQYPPDPSAIAFLSGVPYFNARLRTTCVATRLFGGHAENALPQRAQATINCRMLQTDSPAVVLQTLETVINDEQVSVTPIEPAVPSPPSPLTPEVLGAIEAVTEDMWPGVPVIPTMSTGATDGLYLRNAGIPVYGVSGLFGEISDNRAHGQDERILVKSFFEGQEFLYRLTTRLSREDVD